MDIFPERIFKLITTPTYRAPSLCAAECQTPYGIISHYHHASHMGQVLHRDTEAPRESGYHNAISQPCPCPAARLALDADHSSPSPSPRRGCKCKLQEQTLPQKKCSVSHGIWGTVSFSIFFSAPGIHHSLVLSPTLAHANTRGCHGSPLAPLLHLDSEEAHSPGSLLEPFILFTSCYQTNFSIIHFHLSIKFEDSRHAFRPNIQSSTAWGSRFGQYFLPLCSALTGSILPPSHQQPSLLPASCPPLFTPTLSSAYANLTFKTKTTANAMFLLQPFSQGWAHRCLY
ncbi:hypothetical protein P7K49_029689 [Saguinus oedipus]|uniref:Uncharacterized protein n=1 Tax=Saguinus oedipus TaxID=9490 RepID=A0ABQ9U8S3_SAGOE|nr:hypothetical protein P7K49_029689 [Saguinus oedipus]